MAKPPRPEFWQRAIITHTMADSRRLNWEQTFGPFRHQVKDVLEIGSYEGQSALFWHHFFGATVTCIDTWQSVAKGCRSAEEVEQHFDANVLGLPIFKIKLRSTEALVRLSKGNLIFDLIYIDGDHSRLQVMVDSCLAWPLLRIGGFLCWDDYRDYAPDVIDRPAPAIDAFSAMMADQILVMKDTGQQLIVRKNWLLRTGNS